MAADDQPIVADVSSQFAKLAVAEGWTNIRVADAITRRRWSNCSIVRFKDPEAAGHKIEGGVGVWMHQNPHKAKGSMLFACTPCLEERLGIRPRITATEASMSARVTSPQERKRLLDFFSIMKNPPELSEAGRAEIAKANVAAANVNAALGFPLTRNLVGQLWAAYLAKSPTIDPALLPEWLRNQMEVKDAASAQKPRGNEGLEDPRREQEDQDAEAVQGGSERPAPVQEQVGRAGEIRFKNGAVMAVRREGEKHVGGNRGGKTKTMRGIFLDELRKSGSASIRAILKGGPGGQEAQSAVSGEGPGDPRGGEDRREVDHGSPAGTVRADRAGKAAHAAQATKVARVCMDCEPGLTAEFWDGRGWKCLHHPDGEYLSDVKPPGRHLSQGKGWNRQLGWPGFA